MYSSNKNKGSLGNKVAVLILTTILALMVPLVFLNITLSNKNQEGSFENYRQLFLGIKNSKTQKEIDSICKLSR